MDLVVTHGIFSIDGDDFEVENNIWLVGDDTGAKGVDPQTALNIEAAGGVQVSGTAKEGTTAPTARRAR